AVAGRDARDAGRHRRAQRAVGLDDHADDEAGERLVLGAVERLEAAAHRRRVARAHAAGAAERLYLGERLALEAVAVEQRVERALRRRVARVDGVHVVAGGEAEEREEQRERSHARDVSERQDARQPSLTLEARWLGSLAERGSE